MKYFRERLVVLVKKEKYGKSRVKKSQRKKKQIENKEEPN